MSVKIVLQKNIAGSVSKALQAELAKAVRETAFAIEAEAKAKAPVDTGALRASIQSDVSQTDDTLTAEIAVGVDYGPYVELGTVVSAPQPFLTPAAEAQREAFERRLSDAIERAGK
jgi:HK97 gp10 family phage protein